MILDVTAHRLKGDDIIVYLLRSTNDIQWANLPNIDRHATLSMRDGG